MGTKDSLHKNKQITFFVVADFLSAALAWFLFFSFRKFNEPLYASNHEIWHYIFSDVKFYIGITLIPLCWITFYALCGSYTHIWRKSRIRELSMCFRNTIVGCVILFFAIILDDHIENYTDYFKLFAVLFGLQFTTTIVVRLLFISIIKHRINKGKISYNTLFIGKGNVCEELYLTIRKRKQYRGSNFIGYITVNGDTETVNKQLPLLGKFIDIKRIIEQHHVHEVIIAVQSDNRKILDKIYPQVATSNVLLKLLPSTEDHILRTVKDTAVLNEPFMEINLDYLPLWQKIVKRIMDIVFSVLFILLFLPFYVILAIGVKNSSPGQIFYRQERIGKNGKPFHIIKFRSMYQNAEADGPQLSSQNDQRITQFGRFLRRTHLDETPQFFNVLKGDMALVGPRPERQYYIDQIIEKAPYYQLLQMEKPGITSWGQVSYGYAENVDQMIERLRYDIMYIENISILLDIKIIIYTILSMLKLSGK